MFGDNICRAGGYKHVKRNDQEASIVNSTQRAHSQLWDKVNRRDQVQDCAQRDELGCQTDALIPEQPPCEDGRLEKPSPAAGSLRLALNSSVGPRLLGIIIGIGRHWTLQIGGKVSLSI